MNSVPVGPTSGSSGLGFAIPANDLRFVTDRLAKTGKIGAGMLPLRMQQVTWVIAQAFGMPKLTGALVDAIEPGGDQRLRDSIKSGDIILSFDGQIVLDPRDLARKVAGTPVGSSVALEIARGDSRETIHVTIQGWPDAKPPLISDSSPRHLGLQLVAASVGSPGALVDFVDPTGTAADSGIPPGDIILQVQQERVADPDQALRLLQAQPSAQRPYTAALIDRGGAFLWVAVTVP